MHLSYDKCIFMEDGLMDNYMMKNKIKMITTSGLLIALSAIGAMIKIQGTVAFDSMPGYFAALYISPIAGAVVIALGHLLTAFTSGFPMTIPMHLLLMLLMGIIAYIFGILGRKTNGFISCTVATILNGPIATLISAFVASLLSLPLNGMPMFYALVIPLTVAAGANIVLAYIIHKVINNRI